MKPTPQPNPEKDIFQIDDRINFFELLDNEKPPKAAKRFKDASLAQIVQAAEEETQAQEYPTFDQLFAKLKQ